MRTDQNVQEAKEIDLFTLFTVNAEFLKYTSNDFTAPVR